MAVVDSGVQPTHPHLEQCVVGGHCLVAGADPSDWVDRVGHGTAVAAAIHEKAPLAKLIAVRVFDRSLATSAQMLADAIVWSADQGADLINLSLGTPNLEHRDLLAEAMTYVAERGALVVSAREVDGRPFLPGSLEGAAGVLLDWDCPRDQIGMSSGDDPPSTYAASGYPRPIPGVPVEKNLSGISFAVANVTGFLARTIGA